MAPKRVLENKMSAGK